MDNLRRDVHAMWDEAVRRAGSRRAAWLLRATSLGCIAAAQLLQDGARPAAVTLLAPVRPDSVVPRYAAARYGALAQWLAAPLFRDVAPVDMAAALEASGARLLVLAAPRDELCPEPDQRPLRAAVQRARRPLGRGPRTSTGESLSIEGPMADHMDLAIACRRLQPVEREPAGHGLPRRACP